MKNVMLGLGLLVGLAAAGHAATYEIDATHSEVGFKVRHMMVGRTAGKFGKFSGTFEYDPADPKAWKAEGTIEAASIDTALSERDKHLRSADFFDVERFPRLRFESKVVEDWKDGRGLLRGELTLRGVTREVALELVSHGEATDPWGNVRAGFTATGRLDRREFGLVWNKALDKGGVLVGNDVELALEIEGIRRKPSKEGL